MIKKYTSDDIKNSLKKIGIRKGDSIFIHSNLGYLGLLDGCKNADELCREFLDAVKDVLGEDGTLIVPTFSYSFCHGEVYNPYKTETKCGILSTYIRKKYPENRSLDPNFSICGIGKLMEIYKNCNIHESFGNGSFWELFLKYNGKIVCINFDAGSTFVHYIERINNVSYRYNKAFNGVIEINGKIQRDYAVHFVYDGEADAPAMERVDELCRTAGICRCSNLGNGTILAFSAREYFDYFTNILKTRPRVLCAQEVLSDE